MKFWRHIMTRHTITEDFDNRDVVLSAGDIVILLENDRYGEKGYGLKTSLSLSEQSLLLLSFFFFLYLF